MKSFLLRKFSLTTSMTYFTLYVLFFFSGVSALIYQVMWQRMLFAVFGVDLQSVTIIISVFMFGLGVGGLFGGVIADRYAKKLLFLYVLIELGIALFGVCSPNIILNFGEYMSGQSEWITGVASFIILSVPTILMGATFPILVTHVNQFYQNIGRSVSNLYFANTLGAALGAYVSGFVLLQSLDLSQAVNRAAILNFFIAAVAYLMFGGKK